MDPSGIVYLRPLTKKAITVLDLKANAVYVANIPPPPELYDVPLDSTLEQISTAHLGVQTGHQPARNMPIESIPRPYAVHPRVLRLGFDTSVTHPKSGYDFGSLSGCHVQFPCQKRVTNPECYFSVQYNFRSGALLIVAMSEMAVGTLQLKTGSSLVMMADTVIDCGRREYQFTVEFPDLTQCADAHEYYYKVYALKFKISNAPYLATSRKQVDIGYQHQSKGIVGRGAYGEVHKAVNVSTGDLWAIKMISDSKETLDEVKTLSKLSHPNIIEYQAGFRFNNKICIVMELAAGDLYTHVQARKGPLTLRCVQHVLRQLLSGIQYIHNKGYTHRDLKPSNILVTQWDPITDLPTVKLADFGFATQMANPTSIVGTDGYMAPEIVTEWERRKASHCMTQDFHYQNSVDIWSLGTIMSELVDPPWTWHHVRGTWPKESARRLIKRITDNSPEERPTASQCLQDGWFVDEAPSTSQKRKTPTLGESLAPPPKRPLLPLPSASAATAAPTSASTAAWTTAASTTWTTPSTAASTNATCWPSNAQRDSPREHTNAPLIPAGSTTVSVGGPSPRHPGASQASIVGGSRQGLVYPSAGGCAEAAKTRGSFRGA